LRHVIERREAVKAQAVSDPRRDRMIDFDAARDRSVGKAALARDSVEMRRCHLALHRTMQANEHDRLAGRHFAGLCQCSKLQRDAEREQRPWPFYGCTTIHGFTLLVGQLWVSFDASRHQR
jgi:hypothetical protein